MANPEHLAILKQGVEVWNRWREQNPNIEPNLAGADLTGHHFTIAMDENGDVVFFNLANTILRKANLTLCDLANTDCTGADFHEANLSSADLTSSYCSGADFTGADLYNAVFRDTELDGADFAAAIMARTSFSETDLRSAKGLEKVDHRSPSEIGLSTFAQSGGLLPDAFLRGCGVPDAIITFQASLLNSPIQFYSCFISYSSVDQPFAARLHADLQAQGVRCWFAPEDLKIGDPFRQRIDESIRLHDKLLLILSEHSVRSTWVQDEVEAALERERREQRLVLFPIRIDNAVENTHHAWAAAIRRTRQIGDFSKWQQHSSYSKVLERLLRDLKDEGQQRSR